MRDIAEILAKADALVRKRWKNCNPEIVSKVYSTGRKIFLKELASSKPERRKINQEYRQKIWDIDFNCPLFNAGGMFKKGEAYYTVAAQGAGAYLSGTTTAHMRVGNIRNNNKHPFISYPYSYSASNWMGLPNEGHAVVAKRLAKLEKRKGCPIGASLSLDPASRGSVAIDELIEGMQQYIQANVDFIEINESCPNIPHGATLGGLDETLIERLEQISTKVLKQRQKNCPVVVKFSNDTELEQLPKLLDVLIDLKFDGINLGNTSTRYDFYAKKIHKNDKALFEYFTKEYGGGLSGRVLKENSIHLCKTASEIINKKQLSSEFIVIRTGGVENKIDIQESQRHGIKLNQWFSGYFDMFALFGHDVYHELFN